MYTSETEDTDRKIMLFGTFEGVAMRVSKSRNEFSFIFGPLTCKKVYIKVFKNLKYLDIAVISMIFQIFVFPGRFWGPCWVSVLPDPPESSGRLKYEFLVCILLILRLSIFFRFFWARHSVVKFKGRIVLLKDKYSFPGWQTGAEYPYLSNKLVYFNFTTL